MKRLLLFVAGAAILAVAIVAFGQSAGAQAPGPSAGEMLVGGLLQPKGVKVGPDGWVYVAESGTGGDTVFEVEPGFEVKNGYTGRISRIDPETGARETVVDGLASSAGVEAPTEALGPADIAWIGDNLYYLHTHGGEAWGFDDFETGIYRIRDDGSLDLIADIGAFNAENPVAAITSGVQQDIEPGGNPYSMIVRDNAFYVVDGNHNRLMRVTTSGTITEIVEFPNHPVSTGITDTGSGPFTVSYLGPFPFTPDLGKVVTVSSAGTITEVTSGAAMLTDVEFGPGGNLYALQFNNTAEVAGEEPFAPFTGKILRVEDDGSFTPIVTGLTFTTFLAFDGDTAYVVDDGINAVGTGEIWKIENFSAIQPAAATPTAAAAAPTTAPGATATRPTGISAPDTGSGGYAGSDGSLSVTWLLVALTAAAIVTAGTALVVRNRRG